MENSYKDSAKEIVGFVKKKRRKWWIKEDTLQLVDERRHARAVSNTNRRRELDKQVQQQLRRDKREWLNKQCQEIGEFDRLRKAKQLYKQVNSLKTNTFKARQSSINDRNGKTLTEPEHVLGRWKEYGHELFAKPDNEIPVTKTPLTKTEPTPLLSEVEAAVKQMKLGKAAGLDGVPGELIRNAGPSSMRAQHTLCTKIWESGDWPDIWKSQEFVVIYKAGNSKECTNYRTIALISHASKILLQILLNRMRKKIEMELPDEQAGFRPGRSTADMLVIIQVLTEKVMGIGGQALITFIDYSKAFDSISHVQLFDIMLELGFPEHIVTLLQSLYIDQTAVIRWNGSTTETFPIGKGVRQGCILSPHLFSLYTESVMREAEIQDLGYSIGGRNISNARYADDTALIAQSPMEMQQLLDKVNAAGAQRLLKLNVKKTKLMTIGDVPDDINIRVNNDPVEKVKQFKYLGSLKSSDGDCSKDVNARIAMAKRRMCELTTLWKDRSIPVALKMRLVKTLVWTVLSYGAEAWTLKVRDERKITSMEMWLWRRMLRISWMEKRTDISILQELEIKRELLGHVRKRKLTYYGHLCRDHGCQLTKTVVEGYVEGRRRRGRPRKQYIDNIKQWTQLTTSQCVRAAEDRSRWKQLVSQAMVADDYT